MDAFLYAPFPSESVDTTYVMMTRSAAFREITPLPTLVARSSWTTLITTSLWSPANCLGFSLCSFSSLWDTLFRGCCVQDPGSSPRHTTGSQLLPHHKNRLWRAALRTAWWIQLLLLDCPHTTHASVSRHMKRRCGIMGEEDDQSLLWDKLHDSDVRWSIYMQHLTLCFVLLLLNKTLSGSYLQYLQYASVQDVFIYSSIPRKMIC